MHLFFIVYVDLCVTDVLKLADFGLSTIFRNRGQLRKAEKCCGTVPYTAPEVWRGPYDPEKADLLQKSKVFYKKFIESIKDD